jgi:hypothetical protein
VLCPNTCFLSFAVELAPQRQHSQRSETSFIKPFVGSNIPVLAVYTFCCASAFTSDAGTGMLVSSFGPTLEWHLDDHKPLCHSVFDCSARL